MDIASKLPLVVMQEVEGREQHALIQQLPPRMSLERYGQRLTHMLANGYRMAGAFARDICLGLSGFWISAKLYSANYLGVDTFVVAEGYRSAGVGKLLADWMEEEAKRRHCNTVRLDACVANSAAHRFYLREGYHIKSYHFFKSL